MITRMFPQCIGILLLAALAPGCTASPGSPATNQDLAPLMIYGIEPGMPLATVVKRLGVATKRKELEGFITTELIYPAIVVGFDEVGTVAAIESRSSDACILTKICPGAPLRQMQQELEKHGYLAEVFDDTLIINGDGCWGEVPFKKDRAILVRVRCSP